MGTTRIGIEAGEVGVKSWEKWGAAAHVMVQACHVFSPTKGRQRRKVVGIRERREVTSQAAGEAGRGSSHDELEKGAQRIKP